jgi:PAS domain S-box-containing protein
MSVDRVGERKDHLKALGRVARNLIAAEDARIILQIALAESLQFTGFACGYAAILDRSASGDLLYSELAVQNCPPLAAQNIDLDLDAIQTGQSKLISDWPELDLVPCHTGIQSTLIVPFPDETAIAGVFHLHGMAQTTVDRQILDYLQGLGAHAAIALENAQRYQDLRLQKQQLHRRTEQVMQMGRLGQAIGSGQPLAETVQDLVNVIRDGIGFNIVLLSCVETTGDERMLHRVASAGLPTSAWEKIKEVRQPFAVVADLLQEKYRIGTAYLIPEEEQDLYQDRLEVYTALQHKDSLGPDDWHSHDLFLVPLKFAGGEIAAILSLDDPVTGRRPTAETIDQVEVLASQAAVTLENARLYDDVRNFTAELEERVAERTHDLQRERDQVSALLRITTELATSLDLNRVLYRALELVSDAVGANEGSIFLLDQITGELTYQAAIGSTRPVPAEGELIPFKSGAGLVGWVIQNRRPTLVTDTNTDERWLPLPGSDAEHRSVLSAPLFTGDDVWGVLMLFSSTPKAFSESHLQLVEIAAAQVSPSIYNAELFKLIREQSEQLGSMMRVEREETAKTVAMLESIADGLMVVDADGKVILFNAAAEHIFELSREQIVGEPISKFIGMWGKAGETWGPAVERWTRSPEDMQGQSIHEDNLELGEKIVSVHLAPVIYATGGIPVFIGTVSVFRDITREVELDRMQREWVSTVSHELRTPMTSIKGYADLLVLGAAGTISEEQKGFLNIIKNNADRLSVLVNDLLDISRIETGRMKLDIKPIDLYQLVETVMSNLRGRCEQEGKDVETQSRLPEDMPSVLGDIDRITQVLTNLLDNAFNYTPEGGSITVFAEINEAKGYAVISVRDTGIGISPEDQAKILDRFYRSDDPRVQKVSGTGLGLAIVLHLVEMHGGDLTIFSEGLGKGSTFSFSLPVSPD